MAKTIIKTPPRVAINRKQLLYLAVLVIGLYVLLPQLKIFKQSLHLLPAAKPSLVIVSAMFIAATYVFASATYCLLAFRPIRFGKTFVMQLAAMFVNRLLPAGVGGLGANYAYLRKQGSTAVEATTAAAANNLLGIIGHFGITFLLLAIFGAHAKTQSAGHSHSESYIRYILLGVVVIVLLVLTVIPKLRRKVFTAVHSTVRQLAAYRKRPAKLFAALASSICLTLCNCASLWLCGRALHVSFGFITVLLIFTIGITVGAATPTPGGLGGLEAGLVAGYVSYGATPANALATVLLFRLVSFWFPLIAGALGFYYARRHQYF